MTPPNDNELSDTWITYIDKRGKYKNKRLTVGEERKYMLDRLNLQEKEKNKILQEIDLLSNEEKDIFRVMLKMAEEIIETNAENGTECYRAKMYKEKIALKYIYQLRIVNI